MKKVLIPTKLDKVAADLLRARGFSVVLDTEDIKVMAENNRDSAVLIVRSEKVTPDIMDLLPELKLIVRAGAGYDNIDIKYARRHGIDVMNTPGANANAVAEEVVAMILAVYRHVVQGDMTTRAGLWEKNKFMGRELTGKTVGIIGLGNIGQLVAKRVSGFECPILAFDPVISADLAQHIGVELTTVEHIFAHADIITLHIPETETTRGMINKKLFVEMKENAVLINCARAGIVNETDLAEMQKIKKIIYCTDVYPKDAPGEKTVAASAALMLPHLGASTVEANSTAARRAAEQTVAYFEQGVTNYVVNKAVPDALDAKYQSLASSIAHIAHKFLGAKQSLHQIELTLYGKLHPFFDWMIAPITSGLFPEFDPYQDASNAQAFLQTRGITVINRDPDDRKAYGESITLDLFQGNNPIHKVSIRGTITENKLMISRVNNYRNLYLEPSGNNLFVEYSDEPGVLGRIASFLGSNDINILDVRAPRDVKNNTALAVFKTNVPVPESMTASIAALVKAGKAAIVNND